MIEHEVVPWLDNNLFRLCVLLYTCYLRTGKKEHMVLFFYWNWRYSWTYTKPPTFNYNNLINNNTWCNIESTKLHFHLNVLSIKICKLTISKRITKKTPCIFTCMLATHTIKKNIEEKNGSYSSPSCQSCMACYFLLFINRIRNKFSFPLYFYNVNGLSL